MCFKRDCLHHLTHEFVRKLEKNVNVTQKAINIFRTIFFFKFILRIDPLYCTFVHKCIHLLAQKYYSNRYLHLVIDTLWIQKAKYRKRRTNLHSWFKAHGIWIWCDNKHWANSSEQTHKCARCKPQMFCGQTKLCWHRTKRKHVECILFPSRQCYVTAFTREFVVFIHSYANATCTITVRRNNTMNFNMNDESFHKCQFCHLLVLL